MYFGEKDVEHILEESKKHNVMFIFQTQQEAKKAAKEFREAAKEKVTVIANWMTLKTRSGSVIYFKSAGSISRGMDGYKARVILHIPVLEYVSRQDGATCTMRQFQQEEIH